MLADRITVIRRGVAAHDAGKTGSAGLAVGISDIPVPRAVCGGTAGGRVLVQGVKNMAGFMRRHGVQVGYAVTVVIVGHHHERPAYIGVSESSVREFPVRVLLTVRHKHGKRPVGGICRPHVVIVVKYPVAVIGLGITQLAHDLHYPEFFFCACAVYGFITGSHGGIIVDKAQISARRYPLPPAHSVLYSHHDLVLFVIRPAVGFGPHVNRAVALHENNVDRNLAHEVFAGIIKAGPVSGGGRPHRAGKYQ